MTKYRDFEIALIAGGAAGTSVDLILYPFDTVKTRLQSQHGFWKAGGFRGIYSGLMSAALGSAPTGAMFFCTYEVTKYAFSSTLGSSWSVFSHMVAASLGEVAACLVRVPVEIVKQRTQVEHKNSSLHTFRITLQQEGVRGFYRGFFSTVTREIPFSFLQFPLWEYFKKSWSAYTNKPIEAWQSSVCGAASGGMASGLTTPLDVAKTRIMLAEKGTTLARGNIIHAMKVVLRERGVRGLYAGTLPRMTAMSVGGAIFLGIYEKVNIISHQFFYKTL